MVEKWGERKNLTKKKNSRLGEREFSWKTTTTAVVTTEKGARGNRRKNELNSSPPLARLRSRIYERRRR